MYPLTFPLYLILITEISSYHHLELTLHTSTIFVPDVQIYTFSLLSSLLQLIDTILPFSGLPPLLQMFVRTSSDLSTNWQDGCSGQEKQ